VIVRLRGLDSEGCPVTHMIVALTTFRLWASEACAVYRRWCTPSVLSVDDRLTGPIHSLVAGG
jgi:hypothetical protein